MSVIALASNTSGSPRCGRAMKLEPRPEINWRAWTASARPRMSCSVGAKAKPFR